MSSAVSPALGYMPMPTAFSHKAVFLHGRPMHQKYDDFWIRHPPMNIRHRAKIFAPFSALRGFDECLGSKEELYSDRRILSEEERKELDRRLAVLHRLTCSSSAAGKNRPEVTVTYFSPCMDKHHFAYGRQGKYETVTGIVRKTDPVLTRTIMIDHLSIDLTDIFEITGTIFG